MDRLPAGPPEELPVDITRGPEAAPVVVPLEMDTPPLGPEEPEPLEMARDPLAAEVEPLLITGSQRILRRRSQCPAAHCLCCRWQLRQR
jgi:hypothetical protein